MKIKVKNKLSLAKEIERTIKRHGPHCSLNHIDVSAVTDMSYLFEDSKFNGDISSWDTSNVKNMNYMFCASRFNGDISRWDVSKVKSMRSMFASIQEGNFFLATNFYEDSSQDMAGYMLDYRQEGEVAGHYNAKGCASLKHCYFNGDISAWDVRGVLSMEDMFFKNENFLQDLSCWTPLSAKAQCLIDTFTGCSAPKPYWATVNNKNLRNDMIKAYTIKNILDHKLLHKVDPSEHFVKKIKL